jgi:hypothetical protein
MIVQSCKFKITQPSIHLIAKQYVASFDIPVDDNFLPLLMKIMQAGCNAFDYVKPLAPIQCSILVITVIITEQILIKASIGHIFID